MCLFETCVCWNVNNSSLFCLNMCQRPQMGFVTTECLLLQSFTVTYNNIINIPSCLKEYHHLSDSCSIKKINFWKTVSDIFSKLLLIVRITYFFMCWNNCDLGMINIVNLSVHKCLLCMLTSGAMQCHIDMEGMVSTE